MDKAATVSPPNERAPAAQPRLPANPDGQIVHPLDEVVNGLGFGDGVWVGVKLLLMGQGKEPATPVMGLHVDRHGDVFEARDGWTSGIWHHYKASRVLSEAEADAAIAEAIRQGTKPWELRRLLGLIPEAPKP